MQRLIVKSAFVFMLKPCVLPLLCLLLYFLLGVDLLFLYFSFLTVVSLLSVYKLFSVFHLYFHNIIVSKKVYFSPGIGSEPFLNFLIRNTGCLWSGSWWCICGSSLSICNALHLDSQSP